MTLATGKRFDHYEILSPIGAGGMGEVYRARDTKLGRDVAFKILPEAFATDPDRLLRFQREAQLLASLNHPNIAQIYGVVESDRTRAIVMELVEGETLQARLKRGALPLDEALSIAKQVAEALEAAHDRGIIHRDLKPGNIMIDTDSKVKVLDFGLAKALAPQAPDANLSNSPTLVTALPTQANVLIGTAAYMSPEQVRGHAAGERSDVWAFGCVLYEMLTGQQAFTGETITDLIGGIVRVDPEWNALPASVPSALRSVLKRCLEKDRKRRYHAIGDVCFDLETAGVTSAPTHAKRSREWIAWGFAALFALAAVGVLVLQTVFAPRQTQQATSRFSIDFPPEATSFTDPAAPYPAISPDGRYLVFVATSGGASRLWLRPIGSVTAQPIAATEGVDPSPFWSADSRFIGFSAAGRLKKISVAGGPPQTLSDVDPGWVPGGTWNQNDDILFAKRESINRVSANGGTSTSVRVIDKSKNEVFFGWPSFLPDGNHFLYAVGTFESGFKPTIRIGALDPKDKDIPLSLAGGPRVLYGSPNHLLFFREGTLMAQPFDSRRLSLTGDMFPIAERVGYNPASGNTAFGVSNTGVLVYRATSTATTTELTWFDRSGKKLGVVAAGGYFQRPYLSPDQKYLAVEKRDGSGTADIWMIDLLRGTNSRLTFDPGNDTYPIFSPDGQQVVFTSDRRGAPGLYMKAASGAGSEELIQKFQSGSAATDWSSDGKLLTFSIAAADTGFESWVLPLSGDRKPYPVLNQKYNDYRVRFSPDGHWMLYTSNETGRQEIYVQTFPPSGGKWQVSVQGGNYGYWRGDGKEIIFDSPDGKMMAVNVKLGTTFEAGVPRPLFDILGTILGSQYAITADAQRFLLPLAPPTTERSSLTTVLNWTADIKK